MYRVYGVTRTGYYAWKHRKPSDRQKEEERLLKEIEAIHEKSGYTYGSPRVHAALRHQGKRVSEKRIARLMRENGMKARSAKLALNRAVAKRRPKGRVIFHSDRGIEYAAHAFRDRLKALGYIQSMNRPGKMTDNAHMESFFHSYKSDAYHGFTFSGEQQLRKQIRAYVEFCNQERLHSALGYQSPAAFELSLAA